MSPTLSPSKSIPLPELRSQCKLTQKVLSEPCPEFEEIRRIIGKKQTKQENANAVSEYVAEAKENKERVAEEWFHDNSVANFKKFIKANADYDAAQSAFNSIVPTFGGSMSEWVKGDDIKAATMAGLRVIQKRLAKKISELNDEERKRMEEAGLDPSGEHPSITGLKRHLSAVAEAIIKLEGESQFNWNEYSNLFQS
jgi:hypothetical protein